MLAGYLKKRLGRTEYAQDMEDIVQETLLGAWAHIAEFRGDSQFSTWLCAIAGNIFLNHCTHQRRHGVDASKRFELDTDVDVDADALALSDLAIPEQYLEATERFSTLEKQWSSLPTVWQDAFSLYTFEPLSYEAIAKRLGTPVGTVRSRIHRSRVHLGLL